MALVTAGLLNKQIAGELNLSEITVKMLIGPGKFVPVAMLVFGKI